MLAKEQLSKQIVGARMSLPDKLHRSVVPLGQKSRQIAKNGRHIQNSFPTQITQAKCCIAMDCQL